MSGTQLSGYFRPRVPSAVRKHARRDLAKKARSSANAAGESLREQQVLNLYSQWQHKLCRLCMNLYKNCEAPEINFSQPDNLKVVISKECPPTVCNTWPGAKN